MVYLDLILNLSLLVALSIVSGFIEKRRPSRRPGGAFWQGVLFGGAAVIGMLRPLDLGAGLIFDGRSVMLSLGALFFGPRAAVTAGLMAIACRLWLGGLGTLTGVSVILSSLGIGIWAHFQRKPFAHPLSTPSLYLFGLAVHLAMLALVFTLPLEAALATLRKIGLPVLLLFPLATVLAGKVLADQTTAARLVEGLRQATQDLDVTLQSIGEGVIVTDLEGRVVRLNPEAARLTGCPADDAIGKPLTEVFRVVDARTRTPVANPVAEVLEAGQPVGLANPSLLLAQDGAARHITGNAAPIRRPDGRVSGVVLVFRDISDSYRTQEALRRSEETYRRLFEDHAALKLIIDPATGAIRDANPAAVRFYGWPRKRLMQMNIQDINTLPPDALREEMEKTRSQKRVHFEFRHRRADGSVRDVEVFSSLIAIEGDELLHSIVHDVTDHKRTEAERERLLAAIEQAGEAVCITDLEGTIQYVNPAFEAITGYSQAELRGRSPRILKSGAQDAAYYRNLWETITAGRTWKGRFVNRNKAGALYTEEATISPVCDPAGRITNFVAVKRDITEHERLAAQLLQAQKMESVGRLAGGVAHDFNNMLTVILGHTEILLAQTDPGQPLQEDLHAIREAAATSARITRQLLAFARQQTIAPEVLDLNATVEGMLKMLRRLIGEDIDMAWHPAGQLGPVVMDPSQIDQILANLCVNARDAIEGVGKVTIETANVAIDQGYSGEAAIPPGAYVMLAVSDDGCGMTQETLAKIFDPFFTTKEVGRGTGLGLATVYGIVKQNGGFINVYSEPGQGTTFRIYLPRAADEVPGEGGRPEVKARGGDETILLVEDEAAILKLGRRLLERLEYAVLAAESPEAALRAAAAHPGPIHLVITDVVMPGMNGRDLAERLGAMHPGIRCLYMSGYTANVIAHHGVLDPGVHFLQKPFSVNALAAKVREVLDAE